MADAKGAGESLFREKKIAAAAKIFLVTPGVGKAFCGPGMIKLLTAIKQTGNVRQACENMGMSYSKGWKLLKVLESWIGEPLTVRRQGGKGGGEAYLTERGEAFLEKHQAFLAECQQAVEKVFDRYYPGA
jgi:molybdate transport system regulatory protein